MPTKRYDFIVDGKLLFTKYTNSEADRLSKMLNDKKIKFDLKIVSLI